ncbi:MAG: peptide chain release factor N(5)-glutamine methyltransferase [Ignavibacterium sp.]|nr:peptide chain release factor N(5)-glutamine methyltransferase [Ignavibacterium sp.]
MIRTDLYNELLDEIINTRTYLLDKPEESPENALRALWFLAGGDPRAVERCLEEDLPILSETSVNRLRNLLKKHIHGVPLAHLTGRQRFMDIEFLVGPEALIPRKETEILGYAALEKIRETVATGGFSNIIDLCTGSGNLALALAYHEPKCRIFGADLSVDAITLAQRNAVHLALQDRLKFSVGDLFAPFAHDQYFGQIDMVVCNPPYISSQKVTEMSAEVSNYEPRLAFDGGPFGLSILVRLIAEAPQYLKKGGWLGFEVGLGQGNFIKKRLERNNSYSDIQMFPDMAGNPRAVLARCI